MINTKTPILILLLILLFLLIKCNKNSETFTSNHLGSIASGNINEVANLNDLKNEEIIRSAFKPTKNNIVRTNVFCGKCNQEGFDFNCKECAPHVPEKFGKLYYRYFQAKEDIDRIDNDYTSGAITELEFHKRFRHWFDQYNDLTLLPRNKIRQNEILNDLDIFDIDEEHKILVADNELKKYIPLKTIDKIIKFELANSKNNRNNNGDNFGDNFGDRTFDNSNFSNIENINSSNITNFENSNNFSNIENSNNFSNIENINSNNIRNNEYINSNNIRNNEYINSNNFSNIENAISNIENAISNIKNANSKKKNCNN